MIGIYFNYISLQLLSLLYLIITSLLMYVLTFFLINFICHVIKTAIFDYLIFASSKCKIETSLRLFTVINNGQLFAEIKYRYESNIKRKQKELSSFSILFSTWLVLIIQHVAISCFRVDRRFHAT